MEASFDNGEAFRAGDLEIRPGENIALAGGRPMTLSLHEWRVLTVLAAHADRIVSREELYRQGWGRTLRPGDRSVDVYVHKVRTKLEVALPSWRFIHTHVGFGYRFSAEPVLLGDASR